MIRRMVATDIEGLIALGRLMHAESVYRDLDFSDDKIRTLASEVLADDGKPAQDWACFVAEGAAGSAGGGLIGFFVAHSGESWFGRDRIAGDLGLFVHPTHRGGATALLLVKAFEAWGRGPGNARWLTPAISTCVYPERTRDFYQRLGYAPWGERFIKEV